MKKSKIIIIISVVLGICILIGVFFSNMAKDKKNTEKIMSQIDQNYETFKSNIQEFNTTRDAVYTNIFTDSYYDTIKTNYNSWNTVMKTYEESMTKIQKESTYLDKYCFQYYSDSNINSECTSYQNLYEQILNTFITDVNRYNQILTSYNQYITSVQGEELALYDVEQEYIDYNRDGKFDGKE